MNQFAPPTLSVTPNAELQQLQEGPKVLIVDDEPVVGDICTRALSNCRITLAANGRKALDLIAKTDFDLILTDVNMPDMGGLALLRAIKETHPNQVVIVMAGYACKETILEALKADADDFISKPFNLLQLQTLVNKALEKKKLKEELLQLKQMDRLKTAFLGLISDKLNNPVTAISLFFQNIEQDAFDLNDPVFCEYLAMVHSESDHLVQLIHSLLIYSNLVLDDSPLEKYPIDLCQLTRKITDEARQQLDNIEISLATDFPSDISPIPIDRHRISFVIQALLNNAINACDTGDKIHISLSDNESTVTLTITDPGVGIAVNDQSKIFEKFYQVKAPTRGQSKGFGLGLYYAQLFTSMHDGTITLKSAPGCGTSVALTLPY